MTSARGMLRGSGLAGLAVLAAACVSSEMNVYAVSNGTTRGGVKMALPVSTLVVKARPAPKDQPAQQAGGQPAGGQQPSRERAEAPATFTVGVGVEASSKMFELVGKDDFISRTTLKPTYVEGTPVLKSLSVEVLDRRVDIAKHAVEIAGLLGGDLTFLAPTGKSDGRCTDGDTASPAQLMTAVWKDLSREGNVRVPLTIGESCAIRLTPGPVDEDAILLAEYETKFVQGGSSHNFVASAACRTVEVEIGSRSAGRVRMIDPRYVRVNAIPTKGKLDFSDVCAPPSVTREDDAVSSEMDFVKQLLTAFQNPKQ